MSEPNDQHLPPEPHEGIDAAANPEARTYEAEQTTPLATNGSSLPTGYSHVTRQYSQRALLS